MRQYQFHLSISAERYLDYYRGTARQVIARCPDGLTVSFPASLLKAFVLPSGIRGDFVLTCDDQNKGAVLKRV